MHFKTIYQNPPLNIQSSIKDLKTNKQEQLYELIVSQYKDLNYIGIDHLTNERDIDNLMLYDMISYINENYIGIINIDSILDSSIRTQMIGRFIYIFICTDLTNIILPKIMVDLNLDSPNSISSLNADSLKEVILNVIRGKINILKSINQNSLNDDIYIELLKWTYYVDLMDNNIDNFIEHVIIPLCDRYETDIVSNTINFIKV